MRIENVHPAEYAAQWGMCVGDNVLFYNVAHFDGRAVTHNPAWGVDEWQRFVAVINVQRVAVERAISNPKSYRESGWTREDFNNLTALGAWATELLRKAVKSAARATWNNTTVTLTPQPI